MEYWNTIITEKSWEVLQKIKKEFNFVLIGGWAAYLWAKSHKSKDIDIVVDYKDLNKLKLKYKINKNDTLKKYEIKIDEIDIDIYVPFYSKLPLLEHVEEYTSNVEGFKTVITEALLILKQSAEINRAHTEKGLKDRIDILDLLTKCEINYQKYNNIIKRENLQDFRKRLIEIITTFKEIKYIRLNPRQFKLKKEEILRKLKRL